MTADGSVTPMVGAGEAKERVRSLVAQRADELIAVSHDIHARPELAYEEHYAVARLAGVARSGGLTVEQPAYVADARKRVVLTADDDERPGGTGPRRERRLDPRSCQ